MGKSVTLIGIIREHLPSIRKNQRKFVCDLYYGNVAPWYSPDEFIPDGDWYDCRDKLDKLWWEI